MQQCSHSVVFCAGPWLISSPSKSNNKEKVGLLATCNAYHSLDSCLTIHLQHEVTAIAALMMCTTVTCQLRRTMSDAASGKHEFRLFILARSNVAVRSLRVKPIYSWIRSRPAIARNTGSKLDFKRTWLGRSHQCFCGPAAGVLIVEKLCSPFRTLRERPHRQPRLGTNLQRFFQLQQQPGGRMLPKELLPFCDVLMFGMSFGQSCQSKINKSQACASALAHHPVD